MSIYFIQVGRYFKIGYAADAEQRFANLHKSGTRYTFPADASWAKADRTLYRVVDGDTGREYWIHIALDNFAVGLEWFLDEKPVRQFIEALPVEYDRLAREDLPAVERRGGWCETDYHSVQHGRGVREAARHAAKRAKKARRMSRCDVRQGCAMTAPKWSDSDQADPEPCSNVTWAANNGMTVDWARGMWTCLADCRECRNWPAVSSR